MKADQIIAAFLNYGAQPMKVTLAKTSDGQAAATYLYGMFKNGAVELQGGDVDALLAVVTFGWEWASDSTFVVHFLKPRAIDWFLDRVSAVTVALVPACGTKAAKRPAWKVFLGEGNFISFDSGDNEANIGIFALVAQQEGHEAGFEVSVPFVGIPRFRVSGTTDAAWDLAEKIAKSMGAEFELA